MTTNKLKLEIDQLLSDKKQLVDDFRTYRITKSSDIKLPIDQYCKNTVAGLAIKDVTSNEQKIIGATIFHIIVEKDVEFNAHDHSQSQIINVTKGNGIFDYSSGIIFNEGKSLFINRNLVHRVKYLAGTELLLIFLPSIEVR